jgi:hypothetical protein
MNKLLADGTWECRKSGKRGLLRIYYGIGTGMIMQLEEVSGEVMCRCEQADLVRIQ